MKDGWYYLVYDNELWLDGIKKRILPEKIQEAILEKYDELENTEGYLEVEAGKFTFHPAPESEIVRG